jgi:biofilm PGA synthesis N-glycosyltransferase PgaC
MRWARVSCRFVVMILLAFIIFLFALYSTLITYYWVAWRSLPDYTINGDFRPVKISVIIPARNEEENIATLLRALSEQTYPKEFFEVIVVDDHSTDDTASIVKRFDSVTLLALQEDHINSFKKKAIETGIAAAKGDLIVTTDADCLPSRHWLQIIAACKDENDAVLIAAPVTLIFSKQRSKSLLALFQQLDFMVLQGITGVSVYKRIHSMCNGANLAYEKSAFREVDGFAGINTIASGDDMFLMHKIRNKYPGRLYYLKSGEAIVGSQGMKTWREFFNQRIRWASKASHYQDKSLVLVLSLVYLCNLSFLVLLVAALWNPQYWWWLLGMWVLKTIIEFPFVNSVAFFYGKRSLMKYFFFFQPLHICYTIISGIFGQFGTYEWKGRVVR